MTSKIMFHDNTTSRNRAACSISSIRNIKSDQIQAMHPIYYWN